jgi:HSP20 family protein
MARNQETNVPVRRSEEQQGFLPSRVFGPIGLAPLSISSPWQMMRRMQEDLDRVFGQIVSPFQSGGLPRAEMLSTVMPSMDVSETDKEVLVEVDLPGFKQDEISVEVQDGQLVLRGETKRVSPNGQEENRQYHRRERRYGFFEQTFTIPQNIDEDRVNAEFKDGVLSLKLPKSEQAARGRKIPIGAQAHEKRQVSGDPSAQQAAH